MGSSWNFSWGPHETFIAIDQMYRQFHHLCSHHFNTNTFSIRSDPLIKVNKCTKKTHLSLITPTFCIWFRVNFNIESTIQVQSCPNMIPLKFPLLTLYIPRQQTFFSQSAITDWTLIYSAIHERTHTATQINVEWAKNMLSWLKNLHELWEKKSRVVWQGLRISLCVSCFIRLKPRWNLILTLYVSLRPLNNTDLGMNIVRTVSNTRASSISPRKLRKWM